MAALEGILIVKQSSTEFFHFYGSFLYKHMTTFFEHERSSYRRNYMRNLIILAGLDGQVSDREKKLIYRIGKSRGLKTWQLDELMTEDKGSVEVFVPEAQGNRMSLLYDLMLMIYLDGHVDDQEADMIKQIIAKFNLRQQLADHLIDLFRYGAPPAGEWNDFVDHVNREFVKV